ncbi:unnamed protein product [Polarella glacialis]|uniref:RRM domain-containing protein n=1 Tax=Polarella glacialis TaxID=89957 RepID=A0A813I4C0_POLGL|nr:unnamed protein product [Polarella glacialis]
MDEVPTKLFVGCLPYSKTDQDILESFSQFGLVNEVSILRNPDGSSKGAAFVVFQQTDHAMQALSCMQGFLFEGSTRGINVSLAKTGGGGGAAGAGAGGNNHAGLPGNPPPPPGHPLPGQSMAAAAAQAQAEQQQLQMGCGYGCGMQTGGCGKGGGGCQGGCGGMPPQYQGCGMGPSGDVPVPGSKLFIGQLPYSKGEEELWQLFGSIGPLAEVCLLREKSGQSKGAAFVRYQTAQHAAAGVAALDGFLFNGATRPITVSIAQSEAAAAMAAFGTPANKRSQGEMMASSGAQASFASTPSTADNFNHTGNFNSNFNGNFNSNFNGNVNSNISEEVETEEGSKLFIGQLPYSRTEEDLHELFCHFGPLAEVILLRDQTGQKKGAGFVKFFQACHAQSALSMDGYVFQGSPRPISVSLAGSKKRRTT